MINHCELLFLPQNCVTNAKKTYYLLPYLSLPVITYSLKVFVYLSLFDANLLLVFLMILQNNGRIKFGDHQIHFKNLITGKVLTVNVSEIEKIFWMRLGNKPGLKFSLSNGVIHRFGGFADKVTDKDILQQIYISNFFIIKNSHLKRIL